MISTTAFENFISTLDVVGCVVWYDNLILMLLRNEDKSQGNKWGLPAGKVEPEDNNSLSNAMARELSQETGIDADIKDMLYIKQYYVRYLNESDFVFHLFSYKINVLPDVVINPDEHSKYNWLSLEQALEVSLVSGLETCLRDIMNQHRTVELFPDFVCRPHLKEIEKKVEDYFLTRMIQDSDKESVKLLSSIEGTDRFFENNRSIECIRRYESPFNKNILNSKMTVGPIIAYGMPASGKTTTLSKMYHLLRDRNGNGKPLKYIAEPRILIQGTTLYYYLNNMFREKKQAENAFHFQINILHARFLRSYFASPWDLLDEGILSTLAYSRTLYSLDWLTEHEYSIFYECYTALDYILPHPSCILYFYAPLDELKRRMKKRGRNIEKEYGSLYLSKLAESFEYLFYQKYDNNMNMIRIDTTDKSKNEVMEQVLEHYLKLFND